MSDTEPTPAPEVEDAPEAQHLEVEDYTEGDLVEAPEWYDDTVNVGDVANVEAGQ